MQQHLKKQLLYKRPRILGIGRVTWPGSVKTVRIAKSLSLLIYQSPSCIQLGDILYPVNPGDGIIVPEKMEKIHVPKKAATHYWINFDIDGVSKTESPILLPLHAEGMKTDRLDRIEQILLLHSRDYSHAEIKLNDYLLDLLGEKPENRESSPIIDAILRIIETGIHTNLKVGEIAIQLGYSAEHISRLFSQRFQESIVSYIQKRRMKKAYSLLRYTNHPIKEIAAETGIPDLQRFNKTVRKHFGASPRKLRESDTI